MQNRPPAGLFASLTSSVGNRSELWDGPAQSRDSSQPQNGLGSLSLCRSHLYFPSVTVLHPPAGSVDGVVHLVQLQQQVVRNVKCGEANSHCDGSFHPVHAQAFVQSTPDAFLLHDLAHGPQDGSVRGADHAGCLHAPAHHIQRVRSRLSNQARAGSKCQALVRVRMRSLRLI